MVRSTKVDDKVHDATAAVSQGAAALRPSGNADAAAPPTAHEYPSGYAGDPLRWSFLPSTGVLRANTPEPVRMVTDVCEMKCLAIHRPTHRPDLEASGKFPYSWHMKGRRRLWEIRVQLRLKELPKGQMFFGVEWSYQANTQTASNSLLRRVLERVCNAVVGKDFYQTWGEDPKQFGDDAEAPGVALPMWAFDTFLVSEPGSEPDLTTDISGLGVQRTAGMAQYAKAMRQMLSEMSTEKVYTFCVWGPSRMVDVIHGRFTLPGFRGNISSLVGPPPLYVVLYDLRAPGASSGGRRGDAADDAEEKRHLPSRKREYMRVALWSLLEPPPQEALERLGIPDDTAVEASIGREPSSVLRRKALEAVEGCSAWVTTCCTARITHKLAV